MSKWPDTIDGHTLAKKSPIVEYKFIGYGKVLKWKQTSIQKHKHSKKQFEHYDTYIMEMYNDTYIMEMYNDMYIMELTDMNLSINTFCLYICVNGATNIIQGV